MNENLASVSNLSVFDNKEKLPLADIPIENNADANLPESTSQEAGVVAEKIASSEVANRETLSDPEPEETKVNFGFLPVPKSCRVSPTKPFKFNLAINLLFGFASTFTVLPLPRNGR
jgi:hypothetical protein